MDAIDIHTHLPCRKEVCDPRVLRFFEEYGAKIEENRPVALLLSEMDKAGIAHSVVLGTPAQAGFLPDNQELFNDIKAHRDRLIGFGNVDPFTDQNAADTVRRCVEEYGCKGIGEFGCFDICDPACYPVYEACIDLKIPVLFHLGTPLPSVPMKVCHPNLLDDIVIRYPELKVVAAHCAAPWINEMAAVAFRHPNVWIDLSALEVYPLVARVQAVTTMIAAGLGGRLLFGSDFPVTRPSSWIKWLRSFQTPLVARMAMKIPRMTDEERKRMLGQGARELLGI